MFGAPIQRRQDASSSSLCGSGKLGEQAFAGCTQFRESDLGREAKLRDLEVLKHVYGDAALPSSLKEQDVRRVINRGGVWETSNCHCCEVTACTGRMVPNENTGKLEAATSSRRDLQASRHRLRQEDERQCGAAASVRVPCRYATQAKRVPQSRVRITRQTGGNVSHVLTRSLAAKLLLRLDSRSGDVFTQHVLSGRASTLLVSRFHFRLSYFHVAC